MFKFQFIYNDKSYQEFEHITKVKYFNAIDDVVVSENEILEHDFPVSCDMHLYAEGANYSASCKGLKFISITKED